jgi:hypothetical protein
MGVQTKQRGYGHGTPCPCKGGKHTGTCFSDEHPFALTLSDCSTSVFFTWRVGGQRPTNQIKYDLNNAAGTAHRASWIEALGRRRRGDGS